MIKIYKKPRCGFGEAKLHKEIEDVEWTYELIPHLADIDHEQYSVEVLGEDGNYEWDEYCVEWCSCCDTEVVIRSFGVSFCPNCGERILPCTMCDTDYIDCRHCPYDKD